MSELTMLQQTGIWVGLIGGVLGIINSVQLWRKNRPILSVRPGPSPADEEIIVTIANPASHPITIRNSKTWPETVHSLRPKRSSTRQMLAAGWDEDINWLIEGDAEEQFSFIYDDRAKHGDRKWMLLMIFWHSNGAFVFSRVPLFFCTTTARLEKIRQSRSASD